MLCHRNGFRNYFVKTDAEFRNTILKEGRKAMSEMDRRNFVKNSLLGTVGLGVFPKGIFSASVLQTQNSQDEIPKRMLGKTGLNITMLSMPGWHMARMKEEKNAIRMIRMAYDSGINFFDSSWDYEDGKADERLGKAFKSDRQKVFLMTKVNGRTKVDAEKELHESLQRMQTDYLDLWQFHMVGTAKEADIIFGPGGAYELALKAKQEGKIRHIGMTDHRDPNVLLKVMKEHPDTMETFQFPVNVIDPHYMSFIETVIPEAMKHNIGVIAMKTCAIGLIIENKIATVDECLNFAWSFPISTIVSGMDHFDHLKHNIDLAKRFKPMTEEARKQLLARTKKTSGPEYERFKIGGKEWRVFPKDPLL